jgi:hypothetical protein
MPDRIMVTKPAVALLLGLVLMSTPLTGCASRQTPAPAPTPPADQQDQTAEPPPVSSPPGLSASDRVQSAVEGMVVGAAIGMGAGPLGAAVGAGALLIYSAITGHVPLRGASGPSRGPGGGGGGNPDRDEQEREDQIEQEIEREAQRGEELEGQIEEELRRQEELLQQIETGETQSEPGDENLAERADPRTAPEAPKDRELPMAIFEKQKVTIPAKAWGDNARELEVVKRTLDADRDGKPEEIRYFDAKGVMLRREQDRDYDGKLDTFSNYTQEKLARRELDTNADGKIDAWERYQDGRMVSREIDRDQNGKKDAFYTYHAGELVEEKHDSNNDGSFDLVVTYQNKVRVKSVEDRDQDGHADTWTDFRVVSGDELVAKVEKDTNHDDKPDVIESYDVDSGKAVLAKREEDRNGDGTPDITSIYRNGKLVRREISDPALVPL